MAATYSKPTTIPRWADTSGNVVEPSSGKKDAGWLVQEKAISSWENWKAKLIGDWVKWIDERLADGATKDEFIIKDPSTGEKLLEFDYQQIGLYSVTGSGSNGPAFFFRNMDSTGVGSIFSWYWSAKDLILETSDESFGSAYTFIALDGPAKLAKLMDGQFTFDNFAHLAVESSSPEVRLRDTGQTGFGSSSNIRHDGKFLKFNGLDESYGSEAEFLSFNYSTDTITFSRTADFFPASGQDRHSLVLSPGPSSNKATLQMGARTSDPTSFTDGDLWHYYAGGIAEWRTRLNSKTLTLQTERTRPTLKAYAQVNTNGAGGIFQTGYNQNVASVSLTGGIAKVSFSNNLVGSNQNVTAVATGCGGTSPGASTFYHCLPEAANPCTYVEVVAYDGVTGALVNLSSNARWFAIMVNGVLA